MAQPIATHYDNLKVRRDAPVGVIKTSYRKLSQKYHPDRNPDPGALEIMKLINQAWDVLSDPERRARHDRAIAALERRASVQRAPAPAPAPPERHANFLDRHWVRAAAMLALSLVLLFAAFQFVTAGGDDDEVEADAVTTVQPGPEDLPLAAASSDRVPHGYLTSSAQDHTPGIATVEIDNSAGSNDAEVRLFRNGRAARSMFVHQGQRFVVEDLAPGTYVLKYKMVVDGKLIAFQERELVQPQRDKYFKVKIKLFEVAGSGKSADQIAVDQF